MKKALFYLLLVFSIQVYATHNRAGEILYKRIAPFTNTVNGQTVDVYTYSITLIKYSDDGVNVADRCVDTLYFGDGTKSAMNRLNGAGTLTCACSPLCGDLIQNLPGFRVKKNVYAIVHTYPGPGQYVVYNIEIGRNSGVNNIPNSVAQGFYIESLIVANASVGANSSPVINQPPIGIANNVNCFYHNPSATDADGDSLTYELIPCKTINGQSINGYTDPPINNGGYYYMAMSGLISWCMPPSLGEYNIAYYVKEWRKNNQGVLQLIGLVERDFQVLVQAGVVGITNSVIENNSIKIWPNPVDVNLQIETNKDGENINSAELLSLDGQLLQTGTKSGQTILFNMQQLSGGMYLVKINQDEKTTYRKVLKP